MKIENFGRKVKVSTLSPGIVIEEGEEKRYPVVRFHSYPHPFVMSQVICKNPECDCKDITLGFTEIDETGIPLAKPFTFSFSLDLETWQEGKTFKQTKLSQGFVEEFIENLTDEMKTRFMENYEYFKQKARNAQRFKMSAEEIKQGALVSYMDVFGDSGSFVSGGKDIGFSFKNNEKMYFMDDLYCINPRCKCQEVHLRFLTYEQEDNAFREILICRMSFKNRVKIDLAPSSCTKEEAIKILDAWQESEPGTIELLISRYEEMKKIGRQTFPRVGKPSRASMKIFSKKRKKKQLS